MTLMQPSIHTDDESALELARKDMVDILTLDDPVRAFMYDLDFIPIAYDYSGFGIQ